jgi:carotenoid cleavage dioxygenase-like enzyme
MLSGVAFQRAKTGNIQPHFVNQFILTDIFLAAATSQNLRTPVLPSITSLVNPATSLINMIVQILRTVILVLLSYLPGSAYSIKRISVANTGLLYHDGRALATCESGPPIRVQLPGLETVGWFNGKSATGEPLVSSDEPVFGGNGVLGFMKEWTTGHPKVDPVTKEMILYHCSFAPPYVHYSVLPSRQPAFEKKPFYMSSKIMNVPILGVSGSKMMHDFGISREHTVILDLPLFLDPLNLLKGRPVVNYDMHEKSRYGVFPRRDPSAVRWFETSACCIFHTANTWDEVNYQNQVQAVSMLVCRLTSASLVFAAGNLTYDTNISESSLCQPEGCLYYYRFSLLSSSTGNEISHQFALSIIPFDFPTLHPNLLASKARYIYGCSSSASNFSEALAKAVHIDVIAKIDVVALLDRAEKHPPHQITGCVDTRSVVEILSAPYDPQDPIQLYRMPPGWYAQEARFVPRHNAKSEDDGYLLFYAFDESQLNQDGEAPEDAISELWILDAKTMQDVVCRVKLPQRVPYGLHGCWFPKEDIEGQRVVDGFRSLPILNNKRRRSVWNQLRESVIWMIG